MGTLAGTRRLQPGLVPPASYRQKSVLPVAIALLATTRLPGQEEPRIKVDVNLVRVSCVIRNTDGAYRPDVPAGDFTLLEDGVPQRIQYVSRADNLPLTVGLVLDTSHSQIKALARHRDAAGQFLRSVLGEGDRAFVAQFQGRTWLRQPATGEVDRLTRAIASVDSKAPLDLPEVSDPRRRTVGTAYYDAIFYSSRKLFRNENGRRALIVFTDSIDNRSRVSAGDAIEAAQSADAPVYHIRIAPLDKVQTARAPHVALIFRAKGSRAAKRISEETGGRVFDPGKTAPAEIFGQIEKELRSTYEIGYVSSNPARDGKYRKLEVRLADQSLKPRHRKGYRARTD